MFYIAICLTQEYFALHPKLRKKFWYLHELTKTNAYVFASLVFPFSLVTAMMFWTFYYFNSEFIAPLHILSIVPFRVQVGSHLMILVPLITETTSRRKRYSYKLAFLGFNVGMMIYLIT